MKKKVLVTGASGFAGRHLASFLRSCDVNIDLVGTDIKSAVNTLWDRFYVVDISDSDSAGELIRKEAPEYIIHLAGVFGTENIQLTYQVNVLSVVVLLESIRQFSPQAVFLAVGSAAEYGRVDSEKMPIQEDAPCCPVTPYGQSKYMATSIIQYYHRVHSLCTMVVRPFQLIGKGVTSRLAPGAFAARLLEARQSGLNEINVGNLESSRDFLDVRDAVRAMWMLCEKPAPGETFNLCSGIPTKISDLLKMMISVSGIHVQVKIDPSLMRNNADVSIVYGSYEKLRDHSGWQPQKNIWDSITIMFE